MKIRERIGTASVLAAIGAIVGALLGWREGQAMILAVTGAIGGAALGFIDVLYASCLFIVFGLGPIVVLIVGVMGAFEQPQKFLRVFYVVGALGALIGGYIGFESEYPPHRGKGLAKGSLLGVLLATLVAVFLVGMFSSGGGGGGAPAGPNLPPRPPNFKPTGLR